MSAQNHPRREAGIREEVASIRLDPLSGLVTRLLQLRVEQGGHQVAIRRARIVATSRQKKPQSRGRLVGTTQQHRQHVGPELIAEALVGAQRLGGEAMNRSAGAVAEQVQEAAGLPVPQLGERFLTHGWLGASRPEVRLAAPGLAAAARLVAGAVGVEQVVEGEVRREGVVVGSAHPIRRVVVERARAWRLAVVIRIGQQHADSQADEGACLGPARRPAQRAHHTAAQVAAGGLAVGDPRVLLAQLLGHRGPGPADPCVAVRGLPGPLLLETIGQAAEELGVVPELGGLEDVAQALEGIRRQGQVSNQAQQSPPHGPPVGGQQVEGVQQNVLLGAGSVQVPSDRGFELGDRVSLQRPLNAFGQLLMDPGQEGGASVAFGEGEQRVARDASHGLRVARAADQAPQQRNGRGITAAPEGPGHAVLPQVVPLSTELQDQGRRIADPQLAGTPDGAIQGPAAAGARALPKALEDGLLSGLVLPGHVTRLTGPRRGPPGAGSFTLLDVAFLPLGADEGIEEAIGLGPRDGQGRLGAVTQGGAAPAVAEVDDVLIGPHLAQIHLVGLVGATGLEEEADLPEQLHLSPGGSRPRGPRILCRRCVCAPENRSGGSVDQ